MLDKKVVKDALRVSKRARRAQAETYLKQFNFTGKKLRKLARTKVDAKTGYPETYTNSAEAE